MGSNARAESTGLVLARFFDVLAAVGRKPLVPMTFRGVVGHRNGPTGAAFFDSATLLDQPRVEWLQPVLEWSGGGRVDVGKIRIGAVEHPLRAGGAATGAGN